MIRAERISASEDRALERAAAVLQAGGLVAIPTDTVYGLGAALSEPAIARLFDVKDREAAKAIAVLVGAVEQVEIVASSFPPAASLLAARYWPGALTLVVPKRAGLPEGLSPYPTVGVRMPNLAFTLQLLRAAGPLAVTSANRSGEGSATSAEEVAEQLGGAIELIVDGGVCRGGVPSTVVDCTAAEPRILRAGAIPAEEIQSLFTGNA